MQQIKEIDDHAEVLQIEVVLDLTLHGGRGSVNRNISFTRFWRLDDDGVYLITFNSMKPTPGEEAPSEEVFPSVDAIITIAPRSDLSNFDFELPEAMVTCAVQVSGAGNWRPGEQSAFMDSFLSDHLLELRQTVLTERYSVPSAASLSLLTHSHNMSTSLDIADEAEFSGITTTQPGLDELSGGEEDALPHQQQQEVQLSSLVSQKKVTTASLLKKKLFSLTSHKKKTDTNVADTSSLGAIAVPPVLSDAAGSSSPKKKVGFFKHAASVKGGGGGEEDRKQMNSEVISLRNQIAAKDYELERLNKRIKKSRDKELAGLLHQQVELLVQTKALKDAYFALTGKPFNEKTKSKWLAKLRHNKHMQAVAATQTLLQSPASFYVSKDEVEASSPIPLHWGREVVDAASPPLCGSHRLLSLSELYESLQSDGSSSDHRRANLTINVLFLLSVSMTYVLLYVYRVAM